MTSATRPTVTVLMPAYNAEAFVGEAVGGILYQSFSDYEFLIIDDGSTDETGAILRAYAEKDNRIVIVAHDKQQGLIHTLNHGLDLARGRYIARQDADDISLPHRLESQAACMDDHPAIGVCGSWVKTIGDVPRATWAYPCEDGAIRSTLLFRSPFAHPATMLRADILNAHGIRYDSAFPHAEDYALWAALAPHTEFANLAETLLLYRTHAASVTRQKHSVLLNSSARIRRKQLGELGAFSEEDAALHERIGSCCYDSTRAFVHQAESWLHRLAALNRECGTYPQSAFARTLADEWHRLCDRHSYRGLFESLWATQAYCRSPLRAHAPATWRQWWKTACWLTHGPFFQSLRKTRLGRCMRR